MLGVVFLSIELKNILKVASIYITTVIGAGFASGQEIMQFFSTYYEGGFYGILFAGILFSVIGYIVLDKVYSERIKNYDEFIFPTLGWGIGMVMEIIVSLFMLSIFCVMIAGAANIIYEKINIPFIYGIIITACLCMCFILTEIKGVITLSAVISPILIIGIITVGMYIIIFKDTTVFNVVSFTENITDNWFFSSLIYVSYNSLLSIVVMCNLLPYLKSRKTGIVGGVLGGFILCLIALILNLAIFFFYPEIVTSELPLLNIIEKYSNTMASGYTVVLWLAMFVSAVTSGYCFIERVNAKIHVNPKLLTTIVCAVIIPFASLGFSNLISVVYPIFGYAGLFLIFVIILQWVRSSYANTLYKKNFR